MKKFDKEIFFREISLRLLLPLTKKIGIAPEFLLAVRIIFGIITGIILFFASKFIFILFLTICQFVFLLDYIDGPLARYKKRFSFKLLELDRLFHYLISFLFLLGVNVSYFLEKGNILLLLLGEISCLSILITLIFELQMRKKLKIDLSKIRTAQDKKREKFSNLRSLLIIDSPFGLFYFLAIFNLKLTIILLFGFVKIVMLANKILVIKKMKEEKNETKNSNN